MRGAHEAPGALGACGLPAAPGAFGTPWVRPGAARPDPLRGIALLVGAVSLFALLDATAKWLSRTYPVPMVVWARYFFNVVLMLAWLAPAHGARLWATRAPGLQLVRGLALAASTLLMFSALSLMPLADASAITFVGPVLVTLASVRFLGETAPRGTWPALAASLAGVLLIVRPGSGVFTWAALLPLATACCYAAYQVLTRRLSGVDAPMPTLFLGSAVGALSLSLVAPFAWSWPLAAWWHALVFVATGVLGALGHALLIRAFGHAPASTLAPFVYFQLIAALTLGWALFGDFPDGWTLAGMGLVSATGVAMALGQRRAMQAASERAG